MNSDRRLIEDYLPIQAISKEASREKSVRKGHISTLHLWWARRPLVACRAAVYGALIPASRFIPENGPDNKKQSLGRANAAKFVKRLCRYPKDSNPEEKTDIERAVKEAQTHILEAHAERLTKETGNKVTVKDIEEGRAPRPKVLDMFAGGGAIPLEALRLGCDAYALDLNPVAHIIELCTLVYPQKYGKPDPNTRGMTGLPAPSRFWTYVIKCADSSFYIGQTENLLKRYDEHCDGKVEWTAAHRPLELIHWEEHQARKEAVEREHWLKTGFGRKWLKREYDADRLAARQAGPKNEKGLPASLEGLAQPGEPTWGGLANEVRYWGNWVLERVREEIGDLYPPIPDPKYKDHVERIGSTGFPACGIQGDLFIKRRNLPHWQLDGSNYFITFRTRIGVLNSEERQIVLDAIRHFHGVRYWITAAVVMPDHAHILIKPAPDASATGMPLGKLLQGIKGFSAREINKRRGVTGALWQEESFDRIIRDEDEFLEKWNYIRNNPVKARLCNEAEKYPFLWEPKETQGTHELQVGKPEGSQAEGSQAEGSQARKPVLLNEIPLGYLVPVAYLWTRTVRCKNPSCGATVPLVRQTWLCRKEGHHVALKMVARSTGVGSTGFLACDSQSQPGKAVSPKKVRFEVVEAVTEKGLGFDPSAGSEAGNASCSFCGTVSDSDYVKAEGQASSIQYQMMAIVCTRPGKKGKVYLSADDYPAFLPDNEAIRKRIDDLCARTGLTVPDEPIEANPRSMDTQHFGFRTWGDLFARREILCLLTLVVAVRNAETAMQSARFKSDQGKAVITYLSTALDREAEDMSTLCRWNPNAEKMQGTFGRQALPMVWDFCEINPFGGSVGDWRSLIDLQENAIDGSEQFAGANGNVTRGSATNLPWHDSSFDAVITDPPYYDNVSYSNLSDYFYVWLKRTVGHLYPEHFATVVTPKKSEAIAAFYRHGGDKERSRLFYEKMMSDSFREANRVLKPGGQMTVVYAHKTTLGWSSLVDAMRKTGFTVTEAWPLNTEMKSRLVAMDTAALASSIFLVARKRNDSTGAGGGSTASPGCESQVGKPVPLELGSYENDVRPELEGIVRERVATLWEMGITGADLVIAAVGAGLRAFTRFARVEYANGEEVPAEKFLAEVEGVVLETILRRLSREVGSNGAKISLEGLDPETRFYLLWRYTYKYSTLDAGEAIVFANGTHVELDGPNGLASGGRALLEKLKAKYKLKDFTDRGADKKLGMMKENRQPAPLIDALHRALWLMENRPGELPSFLQEAQPNREQMRLVAQVLAGPALKGGEMAGVSPHAELSALGKLTANWKSIIEDSGLSPSQKKARERGQDRLF